MDSLQFEKEYRIHVYETGPDGRLNLEFTMKNEPQSAEINYLAESKYDEEVIIRTSSESENNKFFSHSISRTGDNKDLCRLRIEWRENNTVKS